jgi:uncharacterized protein (TIGR02145 family)
MRTQLTNVRANNIRPLLAATLGLALAFTLSCSGGNPDDNGGDNAQNGCPDAVIGDNTVACGGKTYRTVQIGTQTWMAENLDYAANGSKCYDNNCDNYGRLYNWATAMGLEASCNSSSCASQIQAKHKGICPTGWHIPSKVEWDALATYIESDKGCTSCDAKHLKSTSGWNSNGNGLDSYGFAALPGGHGNSGGDFDIAGNYGYWWSTSGSSANSTYYRRMYYNLEYARWSDSDRSNLFSVRCLQD